MYFSYLKKHKVNTCVVLGMLFTKMQILQFQIFEVIPDLGNIWASKFLNNKPSDFCYI